MTEPKHQRCNKLTIDGQVCGKVVGTCIHKYVPTLFGARPQTQTKSDPKGIHA